MRRRLLLELIYKKAAKHEDIRIKEHTLRGTYAIAIVRIAFNTLLGRVRDVTSAYMEVAV